MFYEEIFICISHDPYAYCLLLSSLVIFYLIVVIILIEKNKLWSCLSYSFLHYIVSSRFLCPNVFQSNLLPKAVCVCVRDASQWRVSKLIN
jgi:hypothetical protein